MIMDKKQAKIIANETFNWCIKKFGNPLLNLTNITMGYITQE